MPIIFFFSPENLNWLCVIKMVILLTVVTEQCIFKDRGGPNLYILFFSNKQGHGLNRKQKDLANRIWV